VIFWIHSKRRPYISEAAAFPREREVLYGPGSYFRVMDVKAAGS
jgi:hypothetical protein